MDPVIYTTTVIRDYQSGAQWISVNGFVYYIKYNTGDEIWFDINGSIVEVKTYDGRHHKYE